MSSSRRSSAQRMFATRRPVRGGSRALSTGPSAKSSSTAGSTRGRSCSTYPTQPLTLLSLATSDLPKGTRVKVAVCGLTSAWAQQGGGNGTGSGNVTQVKSDEYEAEFKLPVRKHRGEDYGS